MITLLFGSIEVTNALSLDRKLVSATQTVADLITQQRTVNAAEINDIFRSAELVMQPFAANDLLIGVTSVRFSQNNGNPRVDWREVRRGGNVTNPLGRAAGLGGAGDSVIIVELVYNYRSVFGPLFFTSLRFTESAVSRPRPTNFITRN